MPPTLDERIHEASIENLAVLREWGAALRRARRRRGLSQTELERRSGVPRSNVRLLEGAHADACLSMWLDLAAGLGYNLDEIGARPRIRPHGRT